jgi:glutathione synthase/RimK-type ligase-like ATP-grasp enzyme
MKRKHRPSVLIIAPEIDPHANVVAKRLQALGEEAIILDSAHFPSRWHLTVSIANGAPRRFVLVRDQLELDDESLLGVWWRRPRRYIPSSDVQESHLRRFITSESRAAFEGWLHCLGDRVINPIAADRSASHKLLQLQSAVEVGLRIPKSLATNSPALAREFFRDNGTRTIYKPFTAANWQLIATQRLSADTLAHVEDVTYAPVIFQEEIDKVADLRVNILDGQVFPILIRTSLKDAPIDWRVDPAREYLAHVLPKPVEAALIALVAKLNLRFAACDLGLTEDGDYVFFEANTGGQWLFAEIMTGQEISWAFARALLCSDRPRVAASNSTVPPLAAAKL